MKNHVNPFDFAEVVSDAQLSEDIISILSQTYDHMVFLSKNYSFIDNDNKERKSK